MASGDSVKFGVVRTQTEVRHHEGAWDDVSCPLRA